MEAYPNQQNEFYATFGSQDGSGGSGGESGGGYCGSPNGELDEVGILVSAVCRINELEAEVARLQEFTLTLANRLFLAAEVLSIVAEKKDKRK